MLPTHLQSGFFELLRSGLWGESWSITPAHFSDRDWAEIYRESVIQTVSGITYAGITNSATSSLPDNNLLAQWTVRTIRIANYNERVNSTISSLAQTLNSEGIVPVLLKGQANGMLYSDPTMREAGDIDFFFQDERDFMTACKIIGKGYITDYKSDGALVCNRNGVMIELHRKMFDMVTPFQRKHLSNTILDLGFKRLEWSDNPSVAILTPTPILNMLMQNLHILRHALCFGIGLRQLCDYAICHKTLNHSEIIRLSAILDKMGLCKWNRMLMSFIDTYIYGKTPSATLSPLYKIVMRKGNFGFGKDSRSWRQVIANNALMFMTVPTQSLTTLFCLCTRR